MLQHALSAVDYIIRQPAKAVRFFFLDMLKKILSISALVIHCVLHMCTTTALFPQLLNKCCSNGLIITFSKNNIQISVCADEDQDGRCLKLKVKLIA